MKWRQNRVQKRRGTDSIPLLYGAVKSSKSMNGWKLVDAEQNLSDETWADSWIRERILFECKRKIERDKEREKERERARERERERERDRERDRERCGGHRGLHNSPSMDHAEKWIESIPPSFRKSWTWSRIPTVITRTRILDLSFLIILPTTILLFFALSFLRSSMYNHIRFAR